jgi:hypothetical protein
MQKTQRIAARLCGDWNRVEDIFRLRRLPRPKKDKEYLVRRLHEEDRMNHVQQECGHAERPAAWSPGSRIWLVMSNPSSDHPSCTFPKADTGTYLPLGL